MENLSPAVNICAQYDTVSILRRIRRKRVADVELLGKNSQHMQDRYRSAEGSSVGGLGSAELRKMHNLTVCYVEELVGAAAFIMHVRDRRYFHGLH